jgi:methyl-accepting chemotaxis protein PixJ
VFGGIALTGDAEFMNIRSKKEPRQDAAGEDRKTGMNRQADRSQEPESGLTKSHTNPLTIAAGQTTVPHGVNSVKRPPSKSRSWWWQRIGLRAKATLGAIAVSTMPIVFLGATAYHLTSSNITQNIRQQQQVRVASFADRLDRFLIGRYQDVQTLASMTLFNRPYIRRSLPEAERQAFLDQYIKNGQGYDSIILLDLDGDVVMQSSGDVIQNYNKIDYFQAALKGDHPVITPPRKSIATGQYSIFTAAPVKDPDTGQTIGVVRTRTPVAYFDRSVQQQDRQLTKNIPGLQIEEFLAFNERGTIFIAPASYPEYLGKDVKAIFPQAVTQLQKSSTLGSTYDINRQQQQEYLLSYAPLPAIKELAKLNWGVAIAQPSDELFADIRGGLLLTFMGATGLTTLLAAASATILVNRALRPIVTVSRAVRKLGQGKLDTRVPVTGEDEVGVLAANINRMAEQLQTQLEQQQSTVERANLLTDLTLQIRQSLNFQDILVTAVREVRRVLKTERVVVYCFDPDWQGKIIAESVAPGWQQLVGQTIDDSCFREGYAQQYREGRVRAIDNIYQAGLAACHVKQLEKFEVKATLVAPLIRDRELLGLLIAHQCSKSRIWQQADIDLFTQLATQIGFALDQAHLLEQVEASRQKAETISLDQRQQKEILQQKLVQLLAQIEGTARGDLTVRANTTTGEIGTVAEFFNAIIESLRQLVVQVKKAATQVNISVDENAGAIRQLADEALKQAQDIDRTLDSVQRMTHSIQAVAASADRAAEVASIAFSTAETGGKAMDRTVQSILSLRDTVTTTAMQAKQLGESTQQISKVVSLINHIALQTNVLAINASIEAGRAGEAGRGFTVVAEEIGQLAAKSAAATQEIEQIVENIQMETTHVVRTMEIGNQQAIAGANFVEDSKQSLGRILEESHQIYQLVQSISRATISQVETAQMVTELMQEIAGVSAGSSEYSRQISNSLQRTVEVAQQLQVSVGKFKVGDEMRELGKKRAKGAEGAEGAEGENTIEY